MKLYLKKSNCTVRDSLNGEVIEVETEEPIFFDDADRHGKTKGWFLIPTAYYVDYAKCNKVPYIETAPKDYKI